MRKKLALLTVVLLAAGGVAQAEGLDPIAVRQAGQDLVLGTFTGIRAVVDAKGDIKKLDTPAKALQRWALVFPTLFPKGTETGHDTKALPAVWSDSAGFQKAAMTFSEAAGKLAEISKTGDLDAVAAQVKVVGNACGACHHDYRAK
jgi:cytochrome c556